MAPEAPTPAHVVVHWIPLGADGVPVVRWSGRLYERLAALLGGREPRDLYHCALEVTVGDDRYALEITPVWGNGSGERGVVAEGPVGLRPLGRLRWFRYEVRCWRDGVIPDLQHAVLRVAVPTDPARAQRLLAAAPRFPPLVWGRDERGLGEMWNSNSLVSWVLAVSGHDVAGIPLPARGRAPGWDAGLAAATVVSSHTPRPVRKGLGTRRRGGNADRALRPRPSRATTRPSPTTSAIRRRLATRTATTTGPTSSAGAGRRHPHGGPVMAPWTRSNAASLASSPSPPGRRPSPRDVTRRG